MAQGLIPGPVLFNNCRSDLDRGAECTLSKLADDTKLGGGADRPDACCTAVQLDPDRLQNPLLCGCRVSHRRQVGGPVLKHKVLALLGTQ